MSDPDVPDDVLQFLDVVLRAVAAADEDHLSTAIGLVLLAQREYQLAVEDDQAPSHVAFEPFVERVIDEYEFDDLEDFRHD